MQKNCNFGSFFTQVARTRKGPRKESVRDRRNERGLVEWGIL